MYVKKILEISGCALKQKVGRIIEALDQDKGQASKGVCACIRLLRSPDPRYSTHPCNAVTEIEY